MRNYDYLPDDRSELVSEIARLDARVSELEEGDGIGPLHEAAPDMLSVLKKFVDAAGGKEATNRWKWLNDCYFEAVEAIAKADPSWERPEDD